MIYLDHAASSPLRPEAWDAMQPFLRSGTNASSLHRRGREGRAALDRARADVARVLGCEPAEVVFTSGGTEADNLALRGTLRAMRRENGRDGLVTQAAEHHAVLHTAEALREDGVDVTVLDAGPTGAPSPDAVARALTDRTALVSVMLVNNEIGTIADVPGIAAAARAAGALVHTDAVQAAGLLDVNADRLGVDLLTLASHKVGGPPGAGALFVRQGTPLDALLVGGAQERGRRGGTENVAAVVGFAAALVAAHAVRDAHASRLAGLRDRLLAALGCAVPGGVRVNTPLGAGRAGPHLLSVSLEPEAGAGLDGEMLLAALDLEGICVSAGSACTSGALEPSHVLRATGVPRATAHATARFSLGWTTTADDVDRAAEVFGRVAARLRAAARG